MDAQIAHNLGAIGTFLFWSGCGIVNSFQPCIETFKEKIIGSIKSVGYAGCLVLILQAFSVMI